MTEDIKNEFKKINVELTETQLEQLDKMTVFLQDYCEKVNLTAIRDREGIIEKHLIDSVLPLTMLQAEQGAKCMDIGTGAGFPAIPMMIYRPDLKFTLLDAQRKRTDYLTLLAKELEIAPEIIHGRAEELGRQDKYKGRYGIVTARAVSDLPTLFKYAAPFLKKGGIFAAMRGSKPERNAEIDKAAEKCRLVFKDEIEYSLPCGDGRRLILFEKVN